jgi:hypothetical protein
LLRLAKLQGKHYNAFAFLSRCSVRALFKCVLWGGRTTKKITPALQFGRERELCGNATSARMQQLKQSNQILSVYFHQIQFCSNEK